MRKILDEKGGMLAMAVIFMLVCTIIGYGLLRLSLADQMETFNATQSMQSFWLAEAGIEKAITSLNPPPSSPDMNIINGGQDWGPGKAYVVTGKPGNENIEWESESCTITSDGTVGTKTRRIEVNIEYNHLDEPDSVLNARGDIPKLVLNDDNTVNEEESTASSNFHEDFAGDGCDNKVNMNDTGFTFDGLFGSTMEELKDMATYFYSNADADTSNDFSNDQSPVEGITYIETGEDKFKVASKNWTGSGILVVDGPAEITGGTFKGILWVTGGFTAGGAIFQGTVFVDGPVDITGEYEDTKLTGNATFDYDPEAIDDALGGLPGGKERDQYKPIDWREIPI